MIGNNEIQFPRERRGLGNGGNPAIHGHYQRYTAVRKTRQGIRMKTISLLTRRDIISDVGAETLQSAQEKRCGCNTVDVVIAVNDDPFMIGQRLLDSRHCFLHILQQKRVIVRLLGFRRQKSPGGCRRRYPSLSEQSRDERRNAGRFGQLFFRLFIMLFDSPNFFHMHAPAFLYTKKESRTLSRILPLAKHGARRGSSFVYLL